MEEEIKTKLCKKCGLVKPVSAFNANKTTKDGLQAHCRSCYREYYCAHQDKICAQVRDYARSHKEVVRVKKKQYRETHEKQIIAGRKRFRAANREKLIEVDRQYYADHKEDILREQKSSRRNHPEVILLRNAKKRAKEAGVPFSIEKSDIIVPKVCPVFGLPLEVGDKILHDVSPTLDRLIPELGYVPGNIAVISHLANTIKNNGTAEEHRLVADWIEGKSTFESARKVAETKHAKVLVDHARKRSAKRNLPFNLKAKDILIPEICPILGIPLVRGKGKMQESSPTIDRFVPELGYVPSNISIISLRANQIKSKGTAQEHRQIADWIDTQLNRPDNGQNFASADCRGAK